MVKYINYIINQVIIFMLKVKLFILSLLMLCTQLYAAAEGGISLLRFAPTDNFKNYIDRGFGVDLYGAWQPDDSIFGIGGYLQFIPYDSTEETDRINETGALSRFNIDVETKSQITNIGLLFQAIPFKGTIQPYLEGQLGFINISTTSEAKSPIGDDEPVFKSENSSDTSFIYGYSLGIKINLFKEKSQNKKSLRRKKSQFGNIALDLKYRRFYTNSKSTFIDPSSITPESNPESWTLVSEKTNYESFHIGLTATF